MISPETLAAALRVNQFAARRAMLAARTDTSDGPATGTQHSDDRSDDVSDEASAHVSHQVQAARASADNSRTAGAAGQRQDGES